MFSDDSQLVMTMRETTAKLITGYKSMLADISNFNEEMTQWDLDDDGDSKLEQTRSLKRPASSPIRQEGDAPGSTH